MRWNFVWSVAYKEILSTFRDRRTLASSIILPLVMIPLFLIGLPVIMAKTFGGEQEKRQNIGIVGLAYAPKALVKALETDTPGAKGVNLTPVTDPLKAVQDKVVEAVIVIPANMPSVAGGAPVPVKIYTKISSTKSSLVLSKITQGIDAYSRALVAARLAQAGLPAQTLTPVVAEPVSADTAAEKASGILAFIIPMFILQWIVVGGQATAIDATAGEKERGTLEALLVTPVSRLEVVVGKLLAVGGFSIMSTVFSMLGLALTGVASRVVMPSLLGTTSGDLTSKSSANSADFASIFGGNLVIGADGLLQLLVVCLSVAAFIAALLIAISIFAKSFKEAQTYLAPVVLLVTLPAIFLQFADFLSRGAALYAVPIIGSMLVILDVVKGVVNWQNAMIVVGINLVCAAVALAFALVSFRKESVLFRN